LGNDTKKIPETSSDCIKQSLIEMARFNETPGHFLRSPTILFTYLAVEGFFLARFEAIAMETYAEANGKV
jgi:hypothetical protein